MEEVIDETVTEEIVEEPVKYSYVVPVKFTNSGKPYSFGTENPDFNTGDYVVVETIQGIEMGIVQAPSLSTDKFPSRHPLRPILRLATDEDKQNYEDNSRYADEAIVVCEEEIKDLGLNMHLLSCSYLLDRSKVLFVYTAEERVDFRELLKRLGSRLHCRIELRQIGERDQAKMVGGIGLCGMECCCSRFKSRFDNISINMAKNQQLALNIDKLSGMCGKLMCCLKYENDIYTELNEGLPKVGAHIEYEGEIFKVTSLNVISKEAKIENNEKFLTLSTDELKEKAIVRKGVSIKHTDNAKKEKIRQVKQDVTTTNIPISNISKETKKEETRVFKQEKEKPQANVTKREFKAKRDDNKNRHHEQNRKSQPQKEQKPSNITVRSFKAKKKEGE